MKKKKKKLFQNWVGNQGFCHFLKFVSLVFLDIAQDCSLGQYLTSSRSETSKITYDPNQGLTCPNWDQNDIYVVMLLGVQSNLLVLNEGHILINKDFVSFKEVLYSCSEHHSAHLFIIAIRSHSHIKQKQTKNFSFMQLLCNHD